MYVHIVHVCEIECVFFYYGWERKKGTRVGISVLLWEDEKKNWTELSNGVREVYTTVAVFSPKRS